MQHRICESFGNPSPMQPLRFDPAVEQQNSTDKDATLLPEIQID